MISSRMSWPRINYKEGNILLDIIVGGEGREGKEKGSKEKK